MIGIPWCRYNPYTHCNPYRLPSGNLKGPVRFNPLSPYPLGNQLLGYAEVVMFAAGIPVGIGTGICANLLWDKIRPSRGGQKLVERTVIEFELGEIKKVTYEKAIKSGK